MVLQGKGCSRRRRLFQFQSSMGRARIIRWQSVRTSLNSFRNAARRFCRMPPSRAASTRSLSPPAAAFSRYHTHDCVRIIGRHHQTPCLEFLGKSDLAEISLGRSSTPSSCRMCSMAWRNFSIRPLIHDAYGPMGPGIRFSSKRLALFNGRRSLRILMRVCRDNPQYTIIAADLGNRWRRADFSGLNRRAPPLTSKRAAARASGSGILSRRRFHRSADWSSMFWGALIWSSVHMPVAAAITFEMRAASLPQ